MFKLVRFKIKWYVHYPYYITCNVNNLFGETDKDDKIFIRNMTIRYINDNF